GAVRSIATFLQRVGRAGHGVGRTPKGRFFPLTLDELAEAAALLDAVRGGELDRIHPPRKPLDILAQQIVAECVPEERDEGELFRSFARAWPYRDLSEEEFCAASEVHLGGRYALLHRDGVHRKLRATRRARLRAIQSGGAIPDAGDYRVLLEPDGTFLGTLNEDFAVEANAGDIVQLGTTSWRILRVETGVVRVADAKGQPPTLPFWLGEGPGRTEELSGAIGDLREWATSPEAVVERTGLPEGAARQLAEFLDDARRVLGRLPTRTRIVCERFFDEAGGTQIVLHAPFGSRTNRALGLALRKRICRGFGYELQAAANEEAILFSLGEKPGVPVDQIFEWLHPRTAREVLVQAMLVTPMFEARWRWNATRALLVDRMKGGKPVPILLQKMRAQDALTEAFPQAVACPETLESPDIDVPMDHPLVRQTVEDCLTEAMDVDGMIRVLEGLRDGSIEGVVVDTPRPSSLAHGILSAGPYAFLDDAPLEERRARAVQTRRALDDRAADTVGALDPDAVRRVKEEAWPDPRDAEEVHEALGWMGYVTLAEAPTWREWLLELEAARRVERDGERWFAVEASRDPVAVLRGRMEALGPVPADAVDPVAMGALEADGAVMRVRHDGRDVFCDRRLLKRIQRHTIDGLRRQIEPATAAEFLRFLSAWQHAAPTFRLEGPAGVATVLTKLAGFEAPARAWERDILPARVTGYRREWLDEVTLSGAFSWGRLFGAGRSPIKTTPLALVPREDLDAWRALAPPPDEAALSGDARAALALLRERGAVFPDELAKRLDLLPALFERAVAELIGHGFLTADSFAAVRSLLVPPSRRRRGMATHGRFSIFREAVDVVADPEFVARRLLDRTGVVLRRTAKRERLPVPWRDLVRVYRRWELRGDVRGGRFVAGFDGEQYAVPEAVDLLRAIRRRDSFPSVEVSAADPLNFAGILTPDPRPAPTAREVVRVS
ncbi:MAG: ATP-dependent DNA helicase, partial [Planctomycetota bacterium JB042]